MSTTIQPQQCLSCMGTGLVPFKYYEQSHRYLIKKHMPCSCSPTTKNEPFFNLGKESQESNDFLYDITRFSNLHSWYKHFRIAQIYYLVPSDKIQDPWKTTEEESQKPRVFWHFIHKNDINGLKLPEALENLVRKFPLSFNQDFCSLLEKNDESLEQVYTDCVNNGWKRDSQEDKNYLEQHVISVLRLRQDMEHLRKEIYEAFIGISSKVGSLLNTSSNSDDIILKDGSVLKRIN